MSSKFDTTWYTNTRSMSLHTYRRIFQNSNPNGQCAPLKNGSKKRKSRGLSPCEILYKFCEGFRNPSRNPEIPCEITKSRNPLRNPEIPREIPKSLAKSRNPSRNPEIPHEIPKSQAKSRNPFVGNPEVMTKNY